MDNNKKASIFIYILLLVTISLILWVVVFNNSITLTNNLNIWKNSEEVFNTLSQKAEIAINTVRKYNNNWNWFIDWISCPTNVTMSWTTSSWTHISTEMVDNYWSIYCSWKYNWVEFRIYFNEDNTDFASAYYKWDTVNLIKTSNTDISLWTTNVNLNTDVVWTQWWNWHDPEDSNDWNTSTWFESKNRTNNEYLEYTFNSNISPWKIIIKKNSHRSWWFSWGYWDDAYIYLYDSYNNLLDTYTISDARSVTQKELDLLYRGLKNDVRKIKIKADWRRRLDLKEFEIYELESNWSEEIWKWEREFNDTDSTLISFTSEWIGGWDLIDDNLNSDDYTVWSTRRADWSIVYYANWYQDDDVIPRKIVFGNVPANTNLYNIYWNNYKTVDFIDKNINNDDVLNIKMWLVSSWAVYLDLYTLGHYDYDLKILEFNRDDYKNKYTLLPIATSLWTNIHNFVWYIQKSSNWKLSLSRYKTWNEYVFDFATKDYWIYISNHDDKNLSYRISAEIITPDITKTWSGIYINPIDDSKTWVISVMSNHMIIGWEKNFIWENFIVTDYK